MIDFNRLNIILYEISAIAQYMKTECLHDTLLRFSNRFCLDYINQNTIEMMHSDYNLIWRIYDKSVMIFIKTI
eukprot:GAHX01002081.1.p1 GENE.GAHX01002081.1~~GAHX01002081.1.p1  ORF type:complete len:73 (-),score=1.39 GAHX01002081.1:75-293(-)